MRRVAAKVDANHAEIRDGLRQLGFSVADTARLGNGFPDLVVGNGVINLLVEVKMPRKNLTPDEKAFLETWKGPAMIAYGIEDVLHWFAVRIAESEGK